jgi:predicted metal-dependent hydrolase
MSETRPAETPPAGGSEAASEAGEPGELRGGRTEPLERREADDLFQRGVALFNGVRYWHAHESWETLWRAAPDEERDFYQGLILVAAGLLHLQRRNMRGARNKLREGVAKLTPYEPSYRGIFVNELVGRARQLVEDLEAGQLPYLIPPVIRFTEAGEADFSR